MHIKAPTPIVPDTVTVSSFQTLSRHCTSSTESYLQVNYLADLIYDFKPQIHQRLPLSREEETLRDYLFEVRNDQDRVGEVGEGLKRKYFMRQNRKSTQGASRNSEKRNVPVAKQKQNYSSEDRQKKAQSLIDIFDPVQYLEEKKIQRQNRLANKIQRQDQPLSFLNQVDSVKYISQAPQIRFPSPLPIVKRKSSFMSNNLNKTTSHHITSTRNNHHNASESIHKILQRSVKLQSQSSHKPKLRKHRSRSQLLKQTEQKITSQRKHILAMMSKHTTVANNTKKPTLSLQQIPAKDKYSMDFVSYLRTKTKSQLDQYIYEKMIKQPEKDIEKFHQFIMKQVKFENDENKHKLERFFIRMRQQFRRIEKYNCKGSTYDWRSRSVHLTQTNKQQRKKLKNSFESQFTQGALLKRRTNSPKRLILNRSKVTLDIEEPKMKKAEQSAIQIDCDDEKQQKQ